MQVMSISHSTESVGDHTLYSADNIVYIPYPPCQLETIHDQHKPLLHHVQTIRWGEMVLSYDLYIQYVLKCRIPSIY